MSFLLVAVAGTAADSFRTGNLLLPPTDVLTHATFHINGGCWKTEKISVSKKMVCFYCHI